MAEQKWYYEKLDEEGKIKRCPMNDDKGKITGKFIINLPAYFDENPEERIKLGWIKHIWHNNSEIEYDHQSQYLQKSVKQIDDFTVEDEYSVFDKTEEMLLLEEMLECVDWGGNGGGIVFVGMEEP